MQCTSVREATSEGGYTKSWCLNVAEVDFKDGESLCYKCAFEKIEADNKALTIEKEQQRISIKIMAELRDNQIAADVEDKTYKLKADNKALREENELFFDLLSRVEVTETYGEMYDEIRQALERSK